MDHTSSRTLRSVSSSATLSSSASQNRWSPVTVTSMSRPQTPAASTVAISASPLSQAVADQEVETLYNHPKVKIVAFTCGELDAAPGTLPWASPLERSIAVGNFTIYRAPGSVAFINCGSALQPILRKSQCWSVDEASTRFVLQIRRPNYWRIELPTPAEGSDGDEERARSRALRDVFDRILMFEKTVCPFTRAFTVELPDIMPIKLVPWVARPTTASDHKQLSPMSRWTHRRLTDSAADLTERSRNSPLRTIESFPEFEQTTSPQEPNSVGFANRKKYWEIRQAEDEQLVNTTSTPTRSRTRSRASSHHLQEKAVLPVIRSVTAPPQLSLGDSPPSKAGSTSSNPSGETILEEGTSASPVVEESPVSSSSAGTWTSPPTSPEREPSLDGKSGILNQEPAPDADSSINGLGIGTASPASEISKFPTMTSESERGAEGEKTPSDNGTRGSTSPERPPMRHRSSISAGIGTNVLSPLPPAVNLFSPPRPGNSIAAPRTIIPSRSLERIRSIPLNIISKAVGVVLGPPKSVLSLMLNVAGKITAGQWSGVVFGVGENGEHIPVQWDYSDADTVNGQWASDDDTLLPGFQGPRRRSFAGGEASKPEQGAWEVD